jgi:hypothetical protein
MNRFQKNLVTAFSLFAIVSIIATGDTATLGGSEDVKKILKKPRPCRNHGLT